MRETFTPQPFLRLRPPNGRAILVRSISWTSDVTVSAGEIFTLLNASFAQCSSCRRNDPRGPFRHDRSKAPEQLVAPRADGSYVDREGTEFRGAWDFLRKKKIDLFPPQNLAGAHARAVLALMEKIRRDLPTENPR